MHKLFFLLILVVVVLTASPAAAIKPACNDGRDNDGDGLIDLADPGCTSKSDRDESNAPPPTGDIDSGANPDAVPSGMIRWVNEEFPVDVALGQWANCGWGNVDCASLPSYYRGRWGAYPDGSPVSNNPIYGVNQPSQVLSVSNGALDFFFHSNASGQALVASPHPIPHGGPNVGLAGPNPQRISARIKVISVNGSGYHMANLLWPLDDNWPTNGEIDFPEGDLSGSSCAYMHRQNGTSGGDQDIYCTSALFTDWHTYTTDWRPDLGYCAFYADGVLIGRSTARVPNTDMRYIMQSDATGFPVDATQAHLKVDWLTVDIP